MFIYHKCHEADKNVLNCNARTHAGDINGKCDICGKRCRLMWCGKYSIEEDQTWNNQKG